MTTMPTRPIDVPADMLDLLVHRLIGRTYAVADCVRHHRPDTDVVAATITALAHNAAIVALLREAIWPLVDEALDRGATVDQLAIAAGPTRAEIETGLCHWIVSGSPTGDVCPWCGSDASHSDTEPGQLCPAQLPTGGVQ